jgi:hypothetical protein
MKNVRVELANKTPRPINDPSPLEKRAAFLHVCGPSQSFLSIFFKKKKKKNNQGKNALAPGAQ